MKTKQYPITRPVESTDLYTIVRVSYSPTEAEYIVTLLASGARFVAKTQIEAVELAGAAAVETKRAA